MKEKIKVYQLTPSRMTGLDSIIYREDTDGWRGVLNQIELELDTQWSNNEDDNGEGWDGIELNIKCFHITEDELLEMTEA